MLINNDREKKRAAMGLPPRKPRKNPQDNTPTEIVFFYLMIVLSVIPLILYLFY